MEKEKKELEEPTEEDKPKKGRLFGDPFIELV